MSNSEIFDRCDERIYQNAGNLPLLELADLDLSGRALDVGCGAGDNARLLTSRGWAVSGITLSALEQRYAAEVCSKGWVHDLEVGLPEDAAGPYDLVVLSHVLEHLRNPGSLLSQIRETLMPKGQVAIALPNALNWHQRLLFVSGRFEYSEQGIMDNTHLRFFTFATARNMLEGCGYRVICATGAGSIVPWGRLRRILPLFTSSIDRLFCWLRPGLFARQLLYIAVRK